ncbi:hypothetical protein SPRG_18956 [Saprolegnia parasitica CBS 223.65]|uniref:Uncharacterized protein n=1 Tax=Saprolegnia parasitica (strain CBS 223.65) TaxID=695850 RepID=A0A067D8F6_SAPPC|nr:hypothetical protein SPRG_18956 [Saprolegnia parasitica CBS 223.65]KDO34946.1 hypothetical protein SPRG_18956 [Saprolegnia parasitica CBS 223.65]|eukprot:XP_012194823.1 hypothetical protein SPRG_18956 [Saprolegnia parasitica CBS 223.65]
MMSGDDRHDVFTRLHVSPRKAAAPLRSYSLTVLHLSPPKPATSSSSAAVRIALVGDPNDPHTLLRAVFEHYASSRASPRRMEPATMDGVGFARFCRACPGLVGRNFGSVDIDLTFAKVKPRGDRRVSYALFVEAIGLVALKKYPDKTLEAAMRSLLDAHIATLPNLDAPAVTTTKAPVVSRALSDAAAQADKVRASLQQLQRQVQFLDLEARKPAPPDDPYALTDRIKFAYMLHDELQALLDAVPKSVSTRVGLVKAVDAAATELESAVRVVAKAQVAWQAKGPPSPLMRRQSVPPSALATYISTRVKVLGDEKRTSPGKAAIARVHLHVDHVADDDDDAWNPFASIFPGLDGNE